MVRCAYCKMDHVIPIVYDLTEVFSSLADLGRVWLGSQLSDPPWPLWYCTGCRAELREDELIVDATYGQSTTEVYNTTLDRLRSIISGTTQDQLDQRRGARWLDVLTKSLALSPVEIRIQRIDSEAIINVVLQDETLSFPSWPAHMFDDLTRYLVAQDNLPPGCSHFLTLKTVREETIAVILNCDPDGKVREVVIRPA